MVSSNKKKRGKQRKAAKERHTSADSAQIDSNDITQLITFTSHGTYVHPDHHKLFARYVERGDSESTAVLPFLTSEDVPTHGICWPNLSLDQSGISTVLAFLKHCEDETFDKVMTDARGSVLTPRGARISNVGGDLVFPSTWIKVLSKAVELEPSCKEKIAKSIGPLVKCMCADMTRLFFKSNTYWIESILPFVQLISDMISKSTDMKVVNTLLAHEGLLASIIQWNFWDEQRPDLVRELSMERCAEISVLGTTITGKLVARAATTNIPSSISEDEKLLCSSIGSMPIVSKDYDPNCMISYTAGLMHFINPPINEGGLFKLLQLLIETGDCIDKDVIMGMIDLGVNHVRDYDGAVVVARLSAIMLLKRPSNKPSDIRTAFAIRFGLVEMCLNLIEQFDTQMSCADTTKDNRCCQCPKCRQSLYNQITSMFTIINDVALHQKTAKAIRSKKEIIEEKLVSLEEDERISSNSNCKEILDMVRSILGINGSYCCRCNKKLSKTEVKQCNGCNIMAYCSRACQKQDWINGHELACCKSYTDETSGQFQGRVLWPTPDTKRDASKLEELEINSNMIQLKLFIDHSETILRQAEALDLPLYDCVVQFDLRECPPNPKVTTKIYTESFTEAKERKGFEESRSKENITCFYISKFNRNASLLFSQRLFPHEWLTNKRV